MNEIFGLPNAKPRRNDEEDLHKAIWQHIKISGAKNIIAYHPANGGSRSKRTGAKLKAMGVVKGVPDLAFVLADCRAAFMEIKIPGGRLEPEQKAFQKRCADMGVEYVVVYSIDSALSVLRAWKVIVSR